MQSVSSQISLNVRYLLWREGVAQAHWVEKMYGALKEVAWSYAEVERLLRGGDANYQQTKQLAYALQQPEEELALGNLLQQSGVDVLKENLRYLIGTLPHGDKKKLATQLGVNPTTISRWLNGDNKPPRPMLTHLAAVFGLSSGVDLSSWPAFLSLEPVSIVSKLRWLHDRIDDLEPEELHDLFPALRRLMEKR